MGCKYEREVERALITDPCVKNLKQSLMTGRCVWGDKKTKQNTAFHEKQSHGNYLFSSLSNSQMLQVVFPGLLEFWTLSLASEVLMPHRNKESCSLLLAKAQLHVS